jgi:hypothetical protein
MQMQVFFLIHIKVDLKQDIYLHVEVLLFHGDLSSKHTSSNHSEIIAIHEASRECIWLRSLIQHIREKCGLSTIKDSPTILYEDNAACITQIRGGYIKGDRTKHISPKFFYTHELQKSGEIDVKQIRSSDNLSDLFTKTLPTATFKKLVNNIGMRRLKDLSS